MACWPGTAWVWLAGLVLPIPALARREGYLRLCEASHGRHPVQVIWSAGVWAGKRRSIEVK